MTREERKHVNKLLRLIEDCVTPEALKAYDAYAKGYLTNTEAATEIALIMFREAERQRAALYKYK